MCVSVRIELSIGWSFGFVVVVLVFRLGASTMDLLNADTEIVSSFCATCPHNGETSFFFSLYGPPLHSASSKRFDEKIILEILIWK